MDGASRQRKDELSEHRRSEILDAARVVFARQGYSETVVEDIALEAGVAKGTLYLYFRSKEQIYLAALLQEIERLSAQVLSKMAGAPTFAAKLRIFLETRLEFIETNQDFLRIYLAEFGSLFVRPKPLPRELEQVFWRSCHFLADAINQAIERGEIRPVPAEAAAMAMHDLARGLFEKRLLGWSKESPAESLEFTYDLILHGLSAKKEIRHET